jgi:hypothetical protein
MSSKTIDIKIEGLRDGEQLRPDLLDVDEIVSLLSYARDFLFPEKGKDRSRISVAFKEGSAVVSFAVDTATALQTHEILADLNANHNLGLLKPRQVEAIEGMQKYVTEQDFVLRIGIAEKLTEGLRIDRKTKWTIPEKVWFDEELYVFGEIVDMGGKTHPNVHIDTKDFGTLTIAANKDLLTDDDKNRLYKEQQLRIRVKRNLETGEFKKGSAQLIEFVDFEAGESPDEYLDRLISESKPYMDKIGDPDQWLKKIRGYEG